MSPDFSNPATTYQHGPLTAQQTPPSQSGYPKFVDLGNGYTIVYTDPYDSGNIVSTKDAAAGSGNALGWSQLANTQANQAAQLQLNRDQIAEQQRQFNESMGYNKAQYNTNVSGHDANGNPTLEAQLGLGNLDVSRGRLGLDTNQQNIDYYKYLANQAANPRNFMENFFLRRGQGAPAGAGAYGNLPSGFAPPSQFQPQPQAPSAQPISGQGYNPTPGQGGAYEGLNSFNPANNKVRLAPNDPDAARLLASNPNLYEMNSADNVAKYLPKFARGGSVHMTGPHALVDLRTGKAVAIAGEAGPETATFNGAALMGSDATRYMDPLPPQDLSDPFGDPNGQMPASNVYTSGGPTAPADTSWPFGDPGGQAPAPGVYTGPTGDPAISSIIQPLQGSPSGATGLPNTSTSGPTLQSIAGNTPAPAGYHWVGQQLIQDAPPSNPLPVQPPSFLPQGGQTFSGLNAPAATTQPANLSTPYLTPRDVAAPGTFGNPIGNRPQFLAGADQSPLAQLTSAGFVPPFLKRAFAQQKGVQSQGTNQPNPYNLPQDVPLLSSLAWQQMTPDEQQAYLSYASSYGVTPEEYLQAIQQFSPQGGPSQLPTFGSPLQFSRQ